MMIRRIGNHWVKLDDGTTWSFDRDGENYTLNWLLRYGSDEEVLRERLTIASILSSYQALIDAPPKRRGEVARAIRSAQASGPDARPHKSESTGEKR
jgi:hypothetical protein